MSIIRLKESNCRNCYKCIRECPVKSIAYKDEKAEILEEGCILCGECLLICPQKAKYVASDLPSLKDALRAGEKVYVSLDASYVAAFPGFDIVQLSAGLKKLGFAHVEETAIGAQQVALAYENLMYEGKMPNIITTACPSVVLLVEKYFPALIPQLAPVAPPAVAHARMMRETYGDDVKVAFIGPCISKKHECVDPANEYALDYVLTFDEVLQWMRMAGVTLGERDSEGVAVQNKLARVYSEPAGMIRMIAKPARRKYECVPINGADQCIQVCRSILEQNLTGYFLELSICTGGCISPVMRSMRTAFLTAKDLLLKNSSAEEDYPAAQTEGRVCALSKQFEDKSSREKAIDEEEIRRILISMGKNSPKKLLNCGGCGYPTCREKAIAVYQGKADIRMCLPFMREQAENMSNAVVEYTPNGILILDEEFTIMEVNPAARKLLRGEDREIKGRPLGEFLPCDDLMVALLNGQPVKDMKKHYEALDIIVEQSLVRVGNQHVYLLMLKDITLEERQRESRLEFSNNAALIAQNVIDKQMRVAQEIASLLGETTAETKLALNKLKKSILSEMSEGGV